MRTADGPEDGSDRITQHEAVERHSSGAGHERHQGAREADEPAEEDGLRPLSPEELLGPLEPGLREAEAAAVMQQPPFRNLAVARAGFQSEPIPASLMPGRS